MSLEQQPIQRDQIVEGLIPHGKHFMFLENAQVLKPGRKAIGQLADRSRPEFQYLVDHFPGFPVFPGALTMEALAELSGIALSSGEQQNSNLIGVLVEDHIKYRGIIRPEDEIKLEAEIVLFKRVIGKSNVRALKGEKVIASGEITFVMVDKSRLTNSE